jgi:hypothetical protein
MVIIDQVTQNISVTRGDYSALVFCAYEDDGVTLHELANGDTVQLQISKKYGNPEKTFSRTKTTALSTTEDDYTIEIPTGATKDMKWGEYVYDVSIIPANGKVCTYIGNDGEKEPKFIILKEVGGTDE